MRNATTRMSTAPMRVSFGSESVRCGKDSGMSQFGTEHPNTILSQCGTNLIAAFAILWAGSPDGEPLSGGLVLSNPSHPQWSPAGLAEDTIQSWRLCPVRCG